MVVSGFCYRHPGNYRCPDLILQALYIESSTSPTANQEMSVVSSAASERSLSFQGEHMSAETMMDTIIKEVQGALNGLQVALRNLCALEDQQVDEEETSRRWWLSRMRPSTSPRRSH